MVDLRTHYLGIPLQSPVIVGASSLTKNIDNMRRMEESGAGAVVVKSLFEEQLFYDEAQFEDKLLQYSEAFAEALTMFPRLQYGGAREHLFWVKQTCNALKIPVIGSLNCVEKSTWVEYARALADTGVAALELNFYSRPMQNHTALDIEARELEIMAEVAQAVSIPVSVKLHPFYTNFWQYVKNIEKTGVKGIILFNRLFLPDVDLDSLSPAKRITLSPEHSYFQSLRWTTLLARDTSLEITASHGLYSGYDIIKLLLAGASHVQVVSALYKNGISHIRTMLTEITQWMEEHKFSSLNEFRGKLALHAEADKWMFERGQYIKAILGFD